jgi:hypothetical protein
VGPFFFMVLRASVGSAFLPLRAIHTLSGSLLEGSLCLDEKAAQDVNKTFLACRILIGSLSSQERTNNSSHIIQIPSFRTTLPRLLRRIRFLMRAERWAVLAFNGLGSAAAGRGWAERPYAEL